LFRNIKSLFHLLLLLAVPGLCLYGCAVSPADSAAALSDYVSSPENGLVQETQSQGYRIAVTYRPTDLLVAQAMDGTHFDAKVVDSLRRYYGAFHYFALSISKDNKEALHPPSAAGSYSELLQTLSFRMDNYVNLTAPVADTIPVLDFALNRTYGLHQSTDLLFVFSKAETSEKQWMQFNLREFGLGVGDQRFRFRMKDLEDVPGLDFSGNGKPG
jgi:hypothetical protein